VATSYVINRTSYFGSDFLFRKLHLQSERIGEAVGQVCHSNQQMQVNDFGLGEVLLQLGDIGRGDLVRSFREFLRVLECGLFLFAEAAVVAGFKSFPIFRGEYSLRRSEMVLGSIVAVIQKRDAQVGSLVEPAVESASHAGVEADKIFQRFRAVRHRFLRIARLAVQSFVVDFFHFGWSVLGFNVADSCHKSSLITSLLNFLL
jgi:hypothetical protein